MSSNVLQNVRLKLQKRVGRLRTADSESFHFELVRFLNFLEEVPVLAAAVAEIVANNLDSKEQVEAWRGRLHLGEIVYGETHLQQAGVAYWVLQKVKRNKGNQGLDFLNYSRMGDFNDALREFTENYVDPFYEELDERIEDRNVVLSALIRYKHSVEWFRQQEYWRSYQGQTSSGERNLAWLLYEYLYHEGIEFAIEPSSASGEADMVQTQATDEPLLADAKIFDPSRGKGKSYIRKGVRQVYTYTQDFHQPIGFLIVFKAAETILSLEGSGTAAGVPYFEINGKTIFVIEVDIFPQSSASVRPIAEISTLTLAEVSDGEGEGDSNELTRPRKGTRSRVP